MWLCGCGEWGGSQVSFCGSQSVFCRGKSNNRIQNLKSKIQAYSRQGGPEHTKGKQKRRRDISVGIWSNTNLSPTLPKRNCEARQKTSGRPGSSRSTWREKREQPKADHTERKRESIKKRQRRTDIAGTITKSSRTSQNAPCGTPLTSEASRIKECGMKYSFGQYPSLDNILEVQTPLTGRMMSQVERDQMESTER